MESGSSIHSSSKLEFCFKAEVQPTTTLYLFTMLKLVTLLENEYNLIICDKKLCKYYPKLLNRSKPSSVLLINSGEKSKSQTVVNLIHAFLSKNQASRSTPIFVIGGGTVSDTAGYAISTFKRGAKLILIPTTLIAMIDASLGGKTGTNLLGYKNQIGTFYPAFEVYIVPEFLDTLPAREFQNGIVEMLKMWFIDDSLVLPIKEKKDLVDSNQILEYAVAKLKICNRDLLDTGHRRLLNLGHSFGHVLESYSQFRIPHGKAVGWGITVAAKLSNQLELINSESLSRILYNLNNYGISDSLPTINKAGFISEFSGLLHNDKKLIDQSIVLVLFTAIRKVEVYPCQSIDTVLHLLETKCI